MMFKSKIYLLITVLGILALAAGACTPTTPHTPTEAPAPTTITEDYINFRFLISDDVNAIDDFASVNVTISKIGVQHGGESGSWLEFTPGITEVDLKPLVGENALAIYSGNLAPGEYSKVFIYVSEVNGILTSELGGEKANVKLPSEKLQIAKPFVISEDTITSFVYDVTVVKAGQSGQYILKPQIAQSGADQEFTEVEQGEGKGQKSEKPGKPEGLEFEGTIEAMGETTWTVKIDGEDTEVNVSGAEIKGEPDIGLHVKIEGTEENGDIVAKEVEVEKLETDEDEEVTLEDTVWVLKEYGDPDDLTNVLGDTEITAEFVSTEGTIKGSAGCNSYFGNYELEGSQLSIPGPIGATEMYCAEPEGVMDQEQEYLATLQLAESYEMDGDELRINCGSQVLIFNSD
jgi:heat shock protein HslJ